MAAPTKQILQLILNLTISSDGEPLQTDSRSGDVAAGRLVIDVPIDPADMIDRTQLH